MTEGSIVRHILEFAIPMAVGLMFQQLYNAVDSVVVGQYVSKQALAAVGSTGNIINMLVGLCNGLSVGAGVVISQRFGAKDYDKLHEAVHTTLCVTFILGVIATAVGMSIVTPMLHMMETPEDVFDQAKTYLTIYFSGMSGLLLYNMGAGILRAVGDSRRPLYFLAFSAGLNIVGDLLFVLVFHMGVAGVALATIIAQFCSAALVLIVLTRTKEPYGVKWNCLRIRWDMLGKILAVGMPSGIQQAITSFSNVFVQSYINAFESACMAGWTSYNKLDAFLLIPVQSIAMASTTFVGQNYGAKKIDRAKEGVKQSLKLSVVITAVLAVLMILCKRPLLRLISPEADVIEFGAYFVSVISPFYVMICFNQIYAGALRGVGNAKVPMVVMLFCFVLFRQTYLYTTHQYFGQSLLLTALAYPAGWVLCSILLAICYRQSILFKKEAGPSYA